MRANHLFENRREIWLFAVLCFLVLSLNSAFKFYEFSKFKDGENEILRAKVAQSYLKTNAKNKIYRVLRLKTDEFWLYTTAKADFEPEINSQILLRIDRSKVKFIEFLSQNFYAVNFGVLELRGDFNESGGLNLRDKIYDLIANQHDTSKMQELYTALFLAAPISKELRDDVNHFGIAHLITISGYHLGLIFGFLYFILRPVYRFFQARFFPYRSRKFDLSVVIFAVLFGYLVLIDFVPSFLRAFLMSLAVFYLLSRNVRILSFEILFVVAAFAVSFMPSLLFSVGFYFSCLGVFYIYLYLHHFGDRFSNFAHMILLNLWVYFAMIIPVLYFFPLISFQQFAVLPLSIAFVLFYPLSAALHLFGAGGAFDEILLDFLSFRLPSANLEIKFWLFLAYNALSLLSIRHRKLAVCVVSVNIFCFGALF